MRVAGSATLIVFRVTKSSHSFLFVSERDVHLFQRDLVERAGHFQSLRLLVLTQALACRIVEFPELFAGVEAARLEQRLRLVDLFFRGAKNRPAFGLFRGNAA